MLLKPAINRRPSAAVRQRRQARRRLPDVARNPVRQAETQTLGLKKWIAILILTPVAFITLTTMVEMFWRMVTRHQLWKTEEFQFFGLGLLAWGALFFLARLRPTKLYVFGHELSHAIAAKCVGAKIYDWDFSATGGYVETNKSNTWISLAPYLLPIYALAVMAGFGVIGLFWNLDTPLTLNLLGTQVSIPLHRPFYIALGLSWAFHVTYTLITLRAEQSDLTRNGEYFSIMLIVVINALLLTLMFVAASPHPELGLAQTLRCWWGVALRLAPWLA